MSKIIKFDVASFRTYSIWNVCRARSKEILPKKVMEEKT